MADRMSPHFSVFNQHVNKAAERAVAEMALAMPAYLKEVQDLEQAENGIMAIFNHSPTPATAVYAALVTLFVNEGRAEADPKPVELFELACPVQYVDFTTKPGYATLWDEQDEGGSRIPVRLRVNELGQVGTETLPR